MGLKRELIRVKGVLAVMCVVAAGLAGCGGDHAVNPNSNQTFELGTLTLPGGQTAAFVPGSIFPSSPNYTSVAIGVTGSAQQVTVTVNTPGPVNELYFDVLGPGGTPLPGFVAVDSLTSNGTGAQTYTFTLTIPPGLAPGVYTLLVASRVNGTYLTGGVVVTGAVGSGG
jgi:hypothetical protein